jgi:hypothetical protein
VHLDEDDQSTGKTSCKRENLKLWQWLDVFAYIDAHLGMNQDKVVKHFGTQANNPWTFTQVTLSWRLKERAEMESHLNNNPNTLESKWPWVVTCPDVEKALFLWHRSMQEKGVVVNRHMLIEKRKHFKELFELPNEERLTAAGLQGLFCRM